jgi:hypothetical protein
VNLSMRSTADRFFRYFSPLPMNAIR